jgi:hypothetical protein
VYFIEKYYENAFDKHFYVLKLISLDYIPFIILSTFNMVVWNRKFFICIISLMILTFTLITSIAEMKKLRFRKIKQPGAQRKWQD